MRFIRGFYSNQKNIKYMKDNINPNKHFCFSQERMIMGHMLRGNRITPLYALEHFGCERLAARIADIKKRGHDVKSEFVTLPSGKRVKQYWIEDQYAPKY